MLTITETIDWLKTELRDYADVMDCYMMMRKCTRGIERRYWQSKLDSVQARVEAIELRIEQLQTNITTG